MSSNKKKPILLILILFPFTFLLGLVGVYVFLFGLQLPVEFKMKVQNDAGKLVPQEDSFSEWATELKDSIKIYQAQFDSLKNEKKRIETKLTSWDDSVATWQSVKNGFGKEVAKLKTEIDLLEKQKKEIGINRLNKLAKILKSIDQNQLDSLIIAGLNDDVLMSFLSQAKGKQAAVILQQMEPLRAARLTSKFVNMGK